MKRTVLMGFSLGLAVAFIFVDIVGIVLLRQRNALTRTIAVDDLGSIQPQMRYDPVTLAEMKTAFPGQTAEEIMGKVMDSVPRSGQFSSLDPLEVYAHVRQGGGIGCGGLSTLYSGALAAHGIPARMVSLQRNYYDLYNTHAAVEVFLDGRWVLFDPSLNISYVMDGKRIGAQGVSDALHDGKVEYLTPRSYGEVAYPVGIEGISEAWFSLLTTFDNVYVMDNIEPSFIEKMPPFRYWIGPRLYYQRIPDSNLQPNQHDFHEFLYFFLIVVLPLASFICGAIAVCAGLHLVMERRSER